jgi:hypothetical protein
MRSSEAEILILPGVGGSGPDHWQSRWAAKLPTARLVAQADWDRPQLEAWRDRIIKEAARATRPVILVGHSLGALTAALAAPSLGGKVKGAFLVAPPAAKVLAAKALAGLASVDPAFSAAKIAPLPFPGLVVASRDDPYAPYDESAALAAALGAELADAGRSGHINSESGHGPWPEGLMRFAGFLKTL